MLRRGHDLTLVTLWTSAAEQEDLEHLAQAGARVLSQPMPSWHSAVNSLMAVPSSTPLQSVYSWRPELYRSLLALVQSHPFDAIHVEHLRGSRYGLELLHHLQRDSMGAKQRPSIVWDSVDCISHLFAQAAEQSRSSKGRLMTRFELPRTRRYEGRLVHSFDHTVVTSRLDKDALITLAEEYAGKANSSPGGLQVASKIDVVPNGVDLEHFSYCGPQHRHANRIVFTGKMSYHANVTAGLHLVNEIMPAVWAQQPDAEVWLVGKDPAPELRALAEKHTDSRRVVVTGEVPAMQDYIQGAAIAVAPLLYGAGIQNKVLEAMACGAPVVASPQASQSLTARPDQDLIVADSPERFATAIINLLHAPEQRAELGHAGRQFVERHHSWDSAVQHLETIYSNCRQTVLPTTLTHP
jgi:glycosyltransferase involved in cell wall biosynthesis